MTIDGQEQNIPLPKPVFLERKSQIENHKDKSLTKDSFLRGVADGYKSATENETEENGEDIAEDNDAPENTDDPAVDVKNTDSEVQEDSSEGSSSSESSAYIIGEDGEKVEIDDQTMLKIYQTLLSNPEILNNRINKYLPIYSG